jgi:hypothetical protein
MNQLRADIIIIGGGLGGCAAALAAADCGRSVILTEETDWLGGQLTSQIVPPDEHGWIERFGRTAAYQRFRLGVRAHYRDNAPLTDEARHEPFLNPGNGWVSPLCHEPKVALAVLQELLAPHINAGRLTVLLRHVPVEVKKNGADLLSGVVIRSQQTQQSTELTAAYIIDATELGDLLELGEVEHVTGQESRTDTGEPSAPAVARPMNMQAFSWCFALEHIAGANFAKTPPENYAYWARYHFPISPPWPGPLLSLGGLNPRTMERVQYRFEPNPPQPTAPIASRLAVIDRTLWTYRRIIDRWKFAPGAHPSDVVVVNWPMNDYLTKSLIGGTEQSRAEALVESKQLSLALLYWLQTEAPRPDGGKGWPGLRTRPDITGTVDGLAKAPYIRESRRIKALVTVREQDVAAASLPDSADRAREFEDSVGIGSYRIDLHPSHGGDNFVDVATLPFQIPLGALIPAREQNLLPAAKNIGTTHITNGCYRLHPVEWNIGEVAGTLAAFCLGHGVPPRKVSQTPDWRRRFQAFLGERGVEISWPSPLVLAEGDPHVHAGSPE